MCVCVCEFVLYVSQFRFCFFFALHNHNSSAEFSGKHLNSIGFSFLTPSPRSWTSKSRVRIKGKLISCNIFESWSVLSGRGGVLRCE